MGCTSSDMVNEDRFEEALNEESVVKQYSWDKRESIRQKENVVSCIQDLNGETVLKSPGMCSAHQIVIQKCQNSSIHFFDHLASVLIKECNCCTLLIGPTEGSFSITRSSNCKVLVACQQLVLKGSTNIDIYLLCASQPLLDSCRHINFYCYQFYYPQLEDQLQRAQLSVYNNFWNFVHDSSTDDSHESYTISNQKPEIETVFGLPDEWQKCGVVLGSDHTTVPYMPSRKVQPSDKSCLVMFFNDGLSHDRARTFIKIMNNTHPECDFVQGREILLKEDESSELFNSDKYTTAIKQGPVIGLEYHGENCRHYCQETLVTVSKGSTGLVFISNAKQLCQQQVEVFRRFAENKLGSIKTPEALKRKAANC